MYSPDEMTAKKKAFATALLKYPEYENRGKAAAEMESRGYIATWVAENWRNDPEVLEYVAQQRGEGGLSATLPTKETFALALWTAANGCKVDDTRLKYLELLGKTLNFIEKPGAVQPGSFNVTNNDNRRVMLMPQPLNLDDWEKAAIKQQQALVLEATPVNDATAAKV